jgi:hypothetical protein
MSAERDKKLLPARRLDGGDGFVRAPLAEVTKRYDPDKVVGFGRPASVAINFHPCEAPTLIEAVEEELADYERRSSEEGGWDDHIGELRAMLDDIAARPPRREFRVIWPTVLAHDVVHRAVTIAMEGVHALSGERVELTALARSQAAAAAAVRTARALDAVDGGGRQDVWL